ncbi:MAG TPA: hypothetical protein VGL68_07280 [Solirubrobacteraceae bacterium]
MIAPAAVAATIVALLIAGCGGSSSTASNGNPTASASAKSPMVARADAICKQLNARRKQANAQVGAVTSSSALPKVARVAPGLAAYERKAIAKLHALSAPASLSVTWRKILAGTQLLAGDTAKLGVDAKAGDLKAVETLIHTDQQKERELITIATTAGFKHCGRNV